MFIKIHKVDLHQLWVFMRTYNIYRSNKSFQFDVKSSFTLVCISLFCILLKVRCQPFSCFSCSYYRDIFEENVFGYEGKLTLIILPQRPKLFNAVWKRFWFHPCTFQTAVWWSWLKLKVKAVPTLKGHEAQLQARSETVSNVCWVHAWKSLTFQRNSLFWIQKRWPVRCVEAWGYVALSLPSALSYIGSNEIKIRNNNFIKWRLFTCPKPRVLVKLSLLRASLKSSLESVCDLSLVIRRKTRGIFKI